MSMQAPAVRIVPPEEHLPVPLQQLLRKLRVDKFHGNVQLNFRDGIVVGAKMETLMNFPTR